MGSGKSAPRQMTGYPMTVGQHSQLGLLHSTARLGDRTARMKPATGRKIAQAGHHASDGPQTLGNIVESRDACHQAPCVGMFRSMKDRRHGGLLDDLPSIHDEDTMAHLR